MARWTAAITTAGEALLAGVQGHIFNFTKAQCGAGSVAVSELVNQTAVTDLKKNLSITSITNASNTIKLRLQLSNIDIAAAFNLYQIAVFAKLDTDVTDVLFMIIQADTPDYIPSASESPNFVNDYVVNVFVGNATSVTGNIDLAAYATVQHMNDISAKADQAVSSANTAIGLAQDANTALDQQSTVLSNVISDLTIVTFQLTVQGLINTDGMKHVIVDNIDIVADVTLTSGKFDATGGKVYI